MEPLQSVKQIILNSQVEARNFRFFKLVNFAAFICIIFHVSFIFLFNIIGVPLLARLNLISCAVFALVLIINRRGFHSLAAGLGMVEIVLFALLTVVMIGWQSGFQYYIIAILPFIYLNRHWRGLTKLSLMFLLYIAFIGQFFYVKTHAPIVAIHPGFLDITHMINIAGLFVIFSGLTYYYLNFTRRVEDRLTHANEKLETLAARDELTGLLNRREMRRLLEKEISRCQASRVSFIVILCDIDDFKKVNDHYGHHAGDQVLVTLSNILRNTLRKDDKLARWGGEEFLLLLPDTEVEAGEVVAEKLREKIALTHFEWEGQPIMMTMTFGVSLFNRDCNFDEVMRQADHALIQGKSMGKNCVIVSPLQI